MSIDGTTVENGSERGFCTSCGNPRWYGSVVGLMRIYVALLRGINVSGKKTVPMPELKKLFSDAGYTSISTYINSGNVVFKSEKSDPDAIRQILEERIEAKFGFEVKVIVIELAELVSCLAQCPFKERSLGAGEQIYLTFLSKPPSRQAVGAIENRKGDSDEHVLRGKVVYLLVKNGYSNTSLNNKFLEKKLCVDSTTRNINTLRKISEIGDESE